ICSFSVAAWLRSTLMRVAVMTKLLGRLSVGDMPLTPVLMDRRRREIRRMTYAPGPTPWGLAAFGGAQTSRHPRKGPAARNSAGPVRTGALFGCDVPDAERRAWRSHAERSCKEFCSSGSDGGTSGAMSLTRSVAHGIPTQSVGTIIEFCWSGS